MDIIVFLWFLSFVVCCWYLFDNSVIFCKSVLKLFLLSFMFKVKVCLSILSDDLFDVSWVWVIRLVIVLGDLICFVVVSVDMIDVWLRVCLESLMYRLIVLSFGVRVESLV